MNRRSRPPSTSDGGVRRSVSRTGGGHATPYRPIALHRLLDTALRDGDSHPLEAFLLDNHDDPAVSDFVARAVAALVTGPGAPVAQIVALLDGWAALDATVVPRDDPRARLPATAPRTYGAVAVARLDWWADERAKLRRGATDPRPASQASIRHSLRAMHAADPARADADLASWQCDPDGNVRGTATIVLGFLEAERRRRADE